MRTTLALCLSLCAIGALVAARPALPTHAELVARVEALEARVNVLEGGEKPKAGIAGPIRQGMTQADFEAALRSARVSPIEKSASDERGAHFEFWEFAPSREWTIHRIMLRDGVVAGIDYFPTH